MANVKVYPYKPPKKPSAKTQNEAAKRAHDRNERHWDAMIHQPSAETLEEVPADVERIDDAYARLLGIGSSRGFRYSSVGYVKGKGRRGNWPI